MRSFLIVFMLVAIAMLCGCSSSGRENVVVGLDDTLVQSRMRPTIQVDIVGLTDAERRQWDQMSISSYWMPGSEVRWSVAGRALQVRFGPERAEPVQIGPDDPIWRTWERAGADWLYIVANLPGGMADQPGTQDQRRLAISLRDRTNRPNGSTIRVAVRRDAVAYRIEAGAE